MAAYYIKVLQRSTGPDEHHAIVCAILKGGADPRVRRDVLRTLEEARQRCDYLVGVLCSELRAQGHEILSVTGDGY